MSKQWYRVVYIEVSRDGMEQEEGFDDVVAESTADAIDQVRRDCETAGAKTHGYKATLLDDAQPYRGVRPIGY